MKTPQKDVRKWASPNVSMDVPFPRVHEGSDPVVKHGTWWYWYDETWSEMYGPYVEEAHARAALEKYVREELG